jgi:hypothetical protein
MIKASLGINILAVLPLASNATSAVLAEMIAPAIIARIASKYFRIGFLTLNALVNAPQYPARAGQMSWQIRSGQLRSLLGQAVRAQCPL